MNEKKILAKNLIRYRKQAKITQAELAEKLNYSDKNISKWERAESLPDILVLKKLSEFYGIKMEDFFIEFSEESSEEVIIKKSTLTKKNKIYITALSSLLVWFIATCVFVILNLTVANIDRSWLAFVYAVPISFVVITVFACLWANDLIRTICCSILSWSLILSVFLTFHLKDFWMLFLIGIPLQILIVIWFYYLKNKKITFAFLKIERKNKKQKENL